MTDADREFASGMKASTASVGFMGMFKTKPDWDLAAHHFDQAAQLFKNEKRYENAVEAFIQAANAYMSLDSTFMAAKNYQNAATTFSVNMNKPEKARPLYQQAARYFQAHGSADKAAELLEKAAKEFESLDPMSAIELQMEACDVFEEESRPRYAVETLHRSVGLLVRHNQLGKAIEILQKLAKTHRRLDQVNSVNKDALSIVIVALATGDEVAATKYNDDFTSQSMQYTGSDEGQLAQMLIEAFQHGDVDALDALKKKQTIHFLGNDIIKLAQSLSVPGANIAKAIPSSNVSAPTPTGKPTEVEEDLGIC